ncbi:hypothetical protein [Wenjunlia tyrosinilytica]|uniref:Uncharacterized protein n=1 Tax=Wenjunlia tyrosinilytica TaxID=1544741 RepID=A0A918E2Q6_9ACTN|nr:hypothetical protein [Wenjunlia tyrosinilytica]GGP00210.1 hypothetical protein GCM10012280_68470 [Wenjunlia tyrosinilytica]
MDPITATAIAAAAIAAKGALESAGGEAGRASWAGASSLVERIRRRFGGDSEAERALEEAQQHPADETAVAGLQQMVHAYMLRDPAFQRDLRRMVDAAVAAQSTGGRGNVNAAVIKTVQVNHGKVEVQGDLNFN